MDVFEEIFAQIPRFGINLNRILAICAEACRVLQSLLPISPKSESCLCAARLCELRSVGRVERQRVCNVLPQNASKLQQLPNDTTLFYSIQFKFNSINGFGNSILIDSPRHPTQTEFLNGNVAFFGGEDAFFKFEFFD